ncbi:MAG: hypothetical protein QXH60_03240 [Candidatus Pacearchaeota archaeon]
MKRFNVFENPRKFVAYFLRIHLAIKFLPFFEKKAKQMTEIMAITKKTTLIAISFSKKIKNPNDPNKNTKIVEINLSKKNMAVLFPREIFSAFR